MDVDGEAGVFHRFRRGGAEGGEARFVLLELGEVLEERRNAGRTEENEDIVEHVGQVAQVAANGAVEYGFRVIDLVLVEDLRNFLLVHVGAGIEELVFLVLLDDLDQVVESGFAVEDLALAVLNVFLQVISGGFRDAEIFHRVGNREADFLAHAEEMVDGIAAREDHGVMIGNVHPLLTEFLRRNAFHMDEFPEVDFQGILLCQLGIRILVRLRFRLCDKDTFYLKIVILRSGQDGSV